MGNPVQEFIKDRGGRKAFAEKLQMRPATVGMWVTRKRIPRTAWPEIIERVEGASLEALKATEGA